MEIRFIDLFAGIGGFALGLERANQVVEKRDNQGRDCTNVEEPESRQQPNSNFRCVWSNDFNKYANQVYTKQFGEANHHSGDIRGINADDIPDHDLLCAGFPCQAFSVAGKRRGFKDTRGTLFFEIQRIAEAKRPRLLLLENVKGLLSHDGGRTFATILNALEELGYWWEYQVLNSKYFGVPQNRERVFIVGHLRGASGREIFPITEDSESNNETGKRPIIRTLTGGGHSGGLHSQMTLIFDAYNHSFREEIGAIKTNEASPTSSSNLIVQPILTPDRKNKRQHGRRFKEDGEEMFTLTGQDVHGVITTEIITDKNRPEGNYLPRERVLSTRGIGRAVSTNESQMPFIKNIPHGYNDGFEKELPSLKSNSGAQYNELLVNKSRIRRLIPVECERLQGFPDGWTETGLQDGKQVKVSDTQRYKLLGNAVTCPVITFLGRRIQQSLMV